MMFPALILPRYTRVAFCATCVSSLIDYATFYVKINKRILIYSWLLTPILIIFHHHRFVFLQYHPKQKIWNLLKPNWKCLFPNRHCYLNVTNRNSFLSRFQTKTITQQLRALQRVLWQTEVDAKFFQILHKKTIFLGALYFNSIIFQVNEL